MCLAQGPQRSDAGEARTRGPSVSSQALYHWATALPIAILVRDLLCMTLSVNVADAHLFNIDAFSEGGGDLLLLGLIWPTNYINYCRDVNLKERCEIPFKLFTLISLLFLS